MYVFWYVIIFLSLYFNGIAYIRSKGPLNGRPLELVDKFTYLGTIVLSIEKAINTRL